MNDNFLKEIKSQPQALRDTFNYIVGEGKHQKREELLNLFLLGWAQVSSVHIYHITY